MCDHENGLSFHSLDSLHLANIPPIEWHAKQAPVILDFFLGGKFLAVADHGKYFIPLVTFTSHTFSESVCAIDTTLGTESDDFMLQLPCCKHFFMLNFYIRFNHLLGRMYAFGVSSAPLFLPPYTHNSLPD